MHKNLIKNIKFKKASAERILSDICQSTSLSKLLGRDSSWAIVGGAVRDSLLASDPYTKPFFAPWPDVDVAVTHTEFNADKRLSQVEEMQISVKQNSFGGWKVSVEDVGELDIWKVKLAKCADNPQKRWLQYLSHVDFANNAVAFFWPECQIIIHPLWSDSIERCEIVRLSSKVIMEHLQAIRAIALAVKLEQTTKIRFNLCEEIVKSLKFLLTNKNEVIMKESLIYLQHKVSSGRWPRSVIERFLIEVINVSQEFNFFQLIEKVLGENITDYNVQSSYKKNKYSKGQKRLFPKNLLKK